MPITFACDYCGQSLSVPETLAGRRGKCRSCGREMTVPGPGSEPDEGGYSLVDPQPEPSAEPIAVEENTFARTHREPRRASAKEAPRPEPAVRKPLNRHQRAELRSLAKRVAVGLGVATVALVLVALVVPSGALLVGGTLAALGIGVVLYGYFTTLYIAWTEDSTYAFLFFLFPPFALWYTVTRMEDLWHRLAIMAAGMAILTVGTWFLRSAVSGEPSQPAESVFRTIAGPERGAWS